MIVKILTVIHVLLHVSHSSASLEKARSLLEKGKYAEALTIYDEIIREDQKNHIAYYLRGFLNELLRRYIQSINDYSNCILLQPDFDKARLSRSQLLTKQGQFKEALEDLNVLIKKPESNLLKEAQEFLTKVNEIEESFIKMNDLLKNKKFNEALEQSNLILQSTPLFSGLRTIRVEILEHLDDKNLLLEELSALSSLTPNDLNLIQKIAHVHYTKGDMDNSNIQIRRCIKSDPEHTQCKQLARKLKNLKKLLDKIESAYNDQKYSAVIADCQDVMKNYNDSSHYVWVSHSYTCRAKYNTREYEDALKHCSTALQLNLNDEESRLTRAELYIIKELFDEAKNDFNAVLEKNSNHQRAHEGLKRIQKILKNKGRRNYYKILNVSKTATKTQIEKAYRAMVRKWHPDHFRDEEKIKEANKKLHDINDARMVLVDEEKRKLFDSGVDPLDPEEQSQRSSQNQGNPFGEQGSFFNFFRGGNPFGENQGGHFRYTFG